jgi:hypothetical protein
MARVFSSVLVVAAALAAAGSAAATELPTHRELTSATNRFLVATPTPSVPSYEGPAGYSAPTDVLPDNRVVAFYGAPQMGQTILGMRRPPAAARKLAAQSAPYADLGDRPVVGAFDLVAVFATAAGGPDNRYRTRQDPQVIEIYLEQARAVDARLMLDIQPGRSTFARELDVLGDWVVQPDVDVAIDPEWNVGRRGIPGRTEGKVTAKEVNAVSKKLAAIVKANDLPPKLLVVHQFRRGSIRQRSRIRSRSGVQIVLNFDGIGSPGPKEAGYGALSEPPLFNGFSLFYSRDTPLMKPAAVLGLDPVPDFLLYQ